LPAAAELAGGLHLILKAQGLGLHPKNWKPQQAVRDCCLLVLGQVWGPACWSPAAGGDWRWGLRISV